MLLSALCWLSCAEANKKMPQNYRNVDREKASVHTQAARLVNCCAIFITERTACNDLQSNRHEKHCELAMQRRHK